MCDLLCIMCDLLCIMCYLLCIMCDLLCIMCDLLCISSSRKLEEEENDSVRCFECSPRIVQCASISYYG